MEPSHNLTTHEMASATPDPDRELTLAEMRSMNKEQVVEHAAARYRAVRQEQAREVVTLMEDETAMAALRALVDSPHPLRAIHAVLFKLRPPF